MNPLNLQPIKQTLKSYEAADRSAYEDYQCCRKKPAGEAESTFRKYILLTLLAELSHCPMHLTRSSWLSRHTKCSWLTASLVVFYGSKKPREGHIAGLDDQEIAGSPLGRPF